MIGWIVAGILGAALFVSLYYNITTARGVEAKLKELVDAAIAQLKIETGSKS